MMINVIPVVVVSLDDLASVDHLGESAAVAAGAVNQESRLDGMGHGDPRHSLLPYFRLGVLPKSVSLFADDCP